MEMLMPLAPLFDEAFAQIVISRNILLVSPEDPDVDSCACIFAFREFLRWQRKTLEKDFGCRIFAPNLPEPNTLFEAFRPLGDPLKDIHTAPPKGNTDLCVIFDYGNFGRTSLAQWAEEHPHTFFIGFDHHPQVPHFPKNGLQIVEATPSATALLYFFFQRANFPINPDVATCLLAGLFADTSRFTNDLASRSPLAFEIGAELMYKGARLGDLVALTRHKMSLASFHAQTAARGKIRFDGETGLGFLSFSQKDLLEWRATTKDILPILGLLNQITELKVAAAYFEKENGKWYGSLRGTAEKNIRVNRIAEQFVFEGRGGGGHAYAAGFTSQDSPDAIFEKLRALLNEKSTEKSHTS